MNKRGVLFVFVLLGLFVFLGSISAADASNSTNATNPLVLTLNGNSTVTIFVGSPYMEQGATATDVYDGNLTSNIIKTINVNIYTVGTYNVSYFVSDSKGNNAFAIRTVYVVPQPPNADTLFIAPITSMAPKNILNNSSNTTNSSSNNSNSATNPSPSIPNLTGTQTPVTGGLIDTLTSTGGIVGIIALVIVLILVIIIARARKKGQNIEMNNSVTTPPSSPSPPVQKK